jgi:nitrate reductase NapE component
MGLPCFLKFFVEVAFIAVLFEFNSVLAVCSAIILMIVGGIGFIRQWLNILYGHPGYPAVRLDLSKEELTVSSILIFFSMVSLPLLFFF